MKQFVLAAILIASGAAARAQLPAGTQDTTVQPTTAQAATTNSPDDASLTAANDALSKADYPTAIKLLTALIASHPHDPHLQYDLGFAQEAESDSQPQAGSPNPRIAAAEAAYRASIAADPKFFEPHLALGLLLARNDKPAEARAELLAAIGLPEQNPALVAHAYRALAHLDLASRPADARDELLAALKLSPETSDDALLAAETAESLGDLPSAEAAYRRLLTARPNDPAATAALAHLLQSEHKAAEAEPLLEAALKAHPEDPSLTAQLADLYAASNDPADTAKALPLVATLHARHPEDQAIARLLARLYTQANQPAQAEPLYTALLQQSPGDATLLSDLGSTLLHLKRFPEAQKLLAQALAIPSSLPAADQPEALSDLAFAASENNDPATSLQALERRATLAPDTAATLFLKATAEDKLHQTQPAIASYKEFLAASNGKFPDQEWQASHRLITLEHKR